MKKVLINFILLLLLSTFVVDTLSAFVSHDKFSIEIADEQKDENKETEKENSPAKDKFFVSCHHSFDILFSKEDFYLHYSSLLPKPYLFRIELPPKSA